MRGPSALALASLLLVACGPTSGSPDAGSDGSAGIDAGDPREDWERALDEIARAYCELEIRCLPISLHEVPADRLRLCHPSAFDRARAEIAAEIGAGHLRLDADAARACLDELARRDCTLRLAGDVDERQQRVALDACRDVLVAEVALGERCLPSAPVPPFFRPPCRDGAYCALGACDAVCVPYAREGEPCARAYPSELAPCDGDLRCSSEAVCVAPPSPGVGAPCASSSECGGTRDRPLRCVEGACSDAMLLVAGEPCDGWECTRGLVCSDRTCAAELREGDACPIGGGESPVSILCPVAAPFCADPDGTGARCAASALGASCTDSWWNVGDPCFEAGLVCRGDGARSGAVSRAPRRAARASTTTSAPRATAASAGCAARWRSPERRAAPTSRARSATRASARAVSPGR